MPFSRRVKFFYSCYQKANKTSIEPAALKDAPFAIFGVRPCDVRAFDVLDRVFLKRACRRFTMQQEESTASLFPWLVMSRKTAASVKPSASMLQNRQLMLLCGR